MRLAASSARASPRCGASRWWWRTSPVPAAISPPNTSPVPPPAATDVIAGRVDCTFAVMASGLPLVQNGQLRALGVSTTNRQPTAPDVPTIAEAGVPGHDTSSWFAFFLPAKTPPEVIRKIQADTVAAMAEPAIKAKLDALGVVIVG